MTAFQTAYAAIGEIRAQAASAGLTEEEFDNVLLPALGDLVQMRIHIDRGQTNGYLVAFSVDQDALNLRLAPWKKLDMSTLLVVQDRLRKFRQEWMAADDRDKRVPGIDVTIMHVDAIIRKEQEKQ